MQVCGLGIQLQIGLGRQVVEIVSFNTGSGFGSAKFLGFLKGFFAPGAGDNVVRTCSSRAEVHRDHGELQAGAALQEKDLIVGRDFQQFAQIVLSIGYDGFEFFRAMADFHHGHAGPFIIEHFCLGLLEDFQRQSGGTGVKVENTLWGHNFSS
jgi:hypothetical protein